MARAIELRSDNAAGVAPEILEAVVAANTGSALAYGGDDWTERLHRLVAEVFEHPAVHVFPVVSGTAANALALSAMCPPWGAVVCHETAHIATNECGSTSLFSGGAVLRGLPGPDARLDPSHLATVLDTTAWGDPHVSQPKVLSLTNPTDLGTVYPTDHVAELAGVAKSRGLRVHLDGARLANAIAALGCSPADLTWRAGVDTFSLGVIKNGGMTADAIVTFERDVADELHYRTKRSGHVASKMRFQSAQIEAYLTDGRWLRWAARSNACMARLAEGLAALGLEVVETPQANMAFVRTGEELATRLEHAGLLFYPMGEGVVRFVTSFQTTEADVDEALARIAEARDPSAARP